MSNVFEKAAKSIGKLEKVAIESSEVVVAVREAKKAIDGVAKGTSAAEQRLQDVAAEVGRLNRDTAETLKGIEESAAKQAHALREVQESGAKQGSILLEVQRELIKLHKAQVNLQAKVDELNKVQAKVAALGVKIDEGQAKTVGEIKQAVWFSTVVVLVAAVAVAFVVRGGSP